MDSCRDGRPCHGVLAAGSLGPFGGGGGWECAKRYATLAVASDPGKGGRSGAEQDGKRTPHVWARWDRFERPQGVARTSRRDGLRVGGALASHGSPGWSSYVGSSGPAAVPLVTRSPVLIAVGFAVPHVVVVVLHLVAPHPAVLRSACLAGAGQLEVGLLEADPLEPAWEVFASVVLFSASRRPRPEFPRALSTSTGRRPSRNRETRSCPP